MPVFDRDAVSEATNLMLLFGTEAALEAASRADRSRSIGNVVHFCRWREIERMILVLSSEDVVGTVH
jgi:hypothetical protein